MTSVRPDSSRQTRKPDLGRHHGATTGARRLVARLALLLLAAAALYQGVWAQFAPRSFYDDFPGGLGWVAVAGPYNEHLVRDVGGLVSGLGVLAIVTAVWLTTPLLVANAVSWLVYSLPHFAFHVAHPLEEAPMQALNVMVLTAEVVLPLAGLLAITAWRRPGPGSSHPLQADEASAL
jgi:hypothetical protein